MYRSILVPTDGSELADKAVQHAIALGREIGAKLTALTVTEPFAVFSLSPVMVEDTPASYAERVNANARAILERVETAARAAGVACEAILMEHAHPYDAIIRTAASKGCDLIVMASHGRRGIAAVVLGSETVKVLTHSQIPVIVVR